MFGVVECFGFGYDVLKYMYLCLIVCDILGYGDDGLYCDCKVYDLLI